MQKTIKIEAGTKARNNVAQVFFTDNKQLEDKELFEIKIPKLRRFAAGHVKADIKYKDTMPGWWGSETTRTGSITLPLNVLIEMTTRGLLETDYQLSAAETKKLLLAIVSGSEKTEKAEE